MMEKKRVDWTKICTSCNHYKNGCGGRWTWHLKTCQFKDDAGSKDFASMVCQIFDEEKALYKKKAGQYAQGDPLANFRGGAALEGLNPESLDDCFKVLLMYMAKHVAFVYQSGVLGNKEDESLGDISVYSNIARAMWRLKKESK